MKSPKNRLPLMIVLSVVLCVIVAILSAVLINAADSSLMQTKIDENRSSMQQAAAKAEKDIGSKADFICLQNR